MVILEYRFATGERPGGEIGTFDVRALPRDGVQRPMWIVSDSELHVILVRHCSLHKTVCI
jgi:hypothetical protein